MNKVFIVIVLCTIGIGLNAQSKLHPNTGVFINLEQTLLDNTLSLADPEYVINKVLLYNKETFERKIFENKSKSIDINLDVVETGLYTGMVYLNGDIVVFNVDVKTLSLNENTNSNKVALEVEKKIIKHYRVISTIHFKYSLSKFNVFTEKVKNELIKKNIFDLTTSNGKKNTMLIYAVYEDNSEQIIYETEPPNDFELFDDAKILAKTN